MTFGMLSRSVQCLALAALLLPQAVPGARHRDGARGEEFRVSPRHLPISPLDEVLRHVEAGRDAFPTERLQDEIAAALQQLGSRLRGLPAQARSIEALLAPELSGGRLRAREEQARPGSRQLHIARAERFAPDTLDRSAFGVEFAALVADYDRLRVAEFHIVEIRVAPDPDPVVHTVVEYDLVGEGRGAWRLQTLGRWLIDWRKGLDGRWQALRWTAVDQTHSRALRPVFVDATSGALGHNPSFWPQLGPGVDHWRRVMDGEVGPDVFGNNGVAAGDVDDDGLDDLYVCQASGLPNRLFRNRGDGTFEDVTEAAGVAVLDASSMALLGDVDNDGDEDLVVVTWRQPLLFLNDGKGRFAREPDAFRFARPPQGAFTAAALADYDRDGLLDLYLCAYTYFLGEGAYRLATPYHDARNGPPNVLFHNEGQGRFVDVTAETGMDQNNDRFSFACAWGDYDNDGWPDLLVANDFGRKNLYRNYGARGGRVRFEDVAAEAGVEDVGAGMSAAWLDYDNDGRLDAYTGNMWSAAGLRVTSQPAFQAQAPTEVLALYRRHARGNSLFHNRGDGTFQDVSLQARVERGRWAWSSDALDFDNDGWEDLYVANGFVTNTDTKDLLSFFWRQVVSQSPLTPTPRRSFEDGWRAINRLIRAEGSWSGRERNVFFRNDRAGGFDDVSGAVGLDFEQDGRAFAVADYDLDGDSDLVLKSRTGPELRFLRNDFGGGNGSIAVRLKGTRSNRDAIGARVTVEMDQGSRTRVVKAGSGFLSQHSKELLIGLGEIDRIHRLTVEWPAGGRQTWTDLQANVRLWIEEGREQVRSTTFHPPSQTPPTATADQGVPPQPPSSSTWLHDRYPAPEFTLPDLEGREHRLARYRGRPALIHFWATRCSPCSEELLALSEALPRIRRLGATLLVVSVDEPGEAEAVRAFARAHVPALTVLTASEEVVGVYNIVSRYLFDRNEDLQIPTTLLLDGQGAIAKVYRGRVEVARILSDLRQLEATPLRRALPFAGTFYFRPPGRNHFQLGIAFAERGLEEPALAAFERAVQVAPRLAMAHYNLGTLYMKKAELARAREAFGRALEAQPDYPEAHNNLGTLMAERGELAAAIVHFEAALEARPDYPDALNNLGHAYLQSGRAQEALVLLRRALELQPGFAEACNNLGILHGNQGDLARAESYFRQALELRPGYGEAANNLAMVWASQGRADEAVRVLECALEAEPQFELTYLTLGRIYLESGRKEQAVRILEHLLRRKPNDPAARRLLSLAKKGG